ncbi:MAG: cbb3-type cytochrome oxidase assembly protein CcoS [Opitutaceae bacterium]
MEWVVYGVLFLIALAISASAVYAFFWASKRGEFRDFDAQSRMIFDDKEPEGVQTDFFPGKRPRRPASSPTESRPQP